jgi:hypothetical protein
LALSFRDIDVDTQPRQHPASAFTCGLDDMAVNGDAESRAIHRDQLRPKLITSSTKRRVNELSGLQHQVADDCESLWKQHMAANDG